MAAWLHRKKAALIASHAGYDDAAFHREVVAFKSLEVELNELNIACSAYLASWRETNLAAERAAACVARFVRSGGANGGAVDVAMADAANAFERVHHKLTPALLIQRIEEQKTELIYVLEKVGRVRREVKERTNTVAAYVSRKAAYEKLNEKLHRSSSLDAEKKAQLAHKLVERKEQLTKAGEALQTSTSSILHEMCDLQARRPILVRSVFETLLRCQQKHAEDTARRLAPLLAEFPDEESVACSVAAVKHVHDADIQETSAASAKMPQFGVPLVSVRRADRWEGSEEGGALPPPLVLAKCVDFISEGHRMATEGLFRVPGEIALVERMRDAFDSGKHDPFARCHVDGSSASHVHAVASLLKLFLRDLPSPLVPVDCFEGVLAASGEGHADAASDVALVRVLTSEPGVRPREHRVALRYLLAFLQRVQKASETMNAKNLSICFAPTVMRRYAAGAAAEAMDPGQQMRDVMLANKAFTRMIELGEAVCGVEDGAGAGVGAAERDDAAGAPPALPAGAPPALPALHHRPAAPPPPPAR